MRRLRGSPARLAREVCLRLELLLRLRLDLRLDLRLEYGLKLLVELRLELCLHARLLSLSLFQSISSVVVREEPGLCARDLSLSLLLMNSSAVVSSEVSCTSNLEGCCSIIVAGAVAVFCCRLSIRYTFPRLVVLGSSSRFLSRRCLLIRAGQLR